ncbi:MAG: GlsB/YeaQ/YmgE family stress response membrane protein [Dehalococcoidia bacterium]|nr:MAG: GlsB/YeaQ/YmgE family stress response membrane protein [Dehalococcoidia bacterium]
MGLLTWILVGLVAGLLAEFALGGGPGGIGPRRLVMAVALGIAGALVGGFLSTMLGFGDVTGFNVRSILIAMGGAILVIMAVRMLSGRRGSM